MESNQICSQSHVYQIDKLSFSVVNRYANLFIGQTQCLEDFFFLFFLSLTIITSDFVINILSY